MEGGIPKVRLDWKMWCSKHLEPLRAKWPRGAPMAMLGLYNWAIRDPGIRELAGGDANRINEALEAASPLCCRAGDEVMVFIIGYAESGKVYNGVDGPVTRKSDGDGNKDEANPA